MSGPSPELLLWVVVLHAPLAGGIPAGVVPEPGAQCLGLGVVEQHPRGYGRSGACGLHPRHRVGGGPWVALGLLDGLLSGGAAGPLRQVTSQDLLPLFPCRPLPVSYQGEEFIEGLSVGDAAQPVPDGEGLWRGLSELPVLAGQGLVSQLAVDQGVVPGPPQQASVFVVLHQPVVGPPGKGQGIQEQRVQAGQFQQSQARMRGLQVRNVEGYEIVAQDEPRSLGHAVQSGQLSSIRRSISSGELLAGVGAPGGEGVDACRVDVNLQVDGQALVQYAGQRFLYRVVGAGAHCGRRPGFDRQPQFRG